MNVDDTNNYHRYEIIVVQELMQDLGLDIKFSDFTVRGELLELFEGWHAHMKYYQEVIYTDLNDDIISNEIYNDKPIK